MTQPDTDVEHKIIQAAIECIETHGLAGTTNREIARIAGVNSAAVNYYFRSKDVLIRRCMELTLENAFDLRSMPPMSELSAQERCTAVMLDLIQGGYTYPGITRADFHALLAEGQRDQLLIDRMNRFIDDLVLDLEGRTGAPPGEELRIGLAQIVSAVILAILAPDLFARRRDLDLRGALASREVYVRRLVTRLMG